MTIRLKGTNKAKSAMVYRLTDFGVNTFAWDDMGNIKFDASDEQAARVLALASTLKLRSV